MTTSSTQYAIRLADGTWYESHALYKGSGCVRTVRGLFPPTLYSSSGEAYYALGKLQKDFPYHADASVIKVAWSMTDKF